MTTLPAPFFIGPYRIDPPLTLAPMAGHSNHAFRTLCRELGGCGLVCTELVSSNVIHQSGVKRTAHKFDWTPDETPIAVQLFGNDPAAMAEAARAVVEHGAQIVDINMGCWVPKVAGKGGGAALLKDVPTATAVVEAVVKAVAPTVPVTVKVRSGWEPGEVTAIPFARAAEQCGVAAIAVHGRFAQQGFHGEADWDVIRQIKELVSIPVIGNGDVTDAQSAARMLALTGCDGVMLGRAALGRPWIFRHIAHALSTGEELPEPTRGERAALALRHAHLSVQTSHLPEKVAVWELRGQLTKYDLDVPGTVAVRDALLRTESLAQIEDVLLPLCYSTAEDAGKHLLQSVL
ncbi:MAG TPA: tRNA dihydrouridine synthase DusB [Aggregatilineales bacterium]|nr:tRNA dihydrouridine synthase DusB [Aggregatilineales bacterium]